MHTRMKALVIVTTLESRASRCRPKSSKEDESDTGAPEFSVAADVHGHGRRAAPSLNN